MYFEFSMIPGWRKLSNRWKWLPLYRSLFNVFYNYLKCSYRLVLNFALLPQIIFLLYGLFRSFYSPLSAWIFKILDFMKMRVSFCFLWIWRFSKSVKHYTSFYFHSTIPISIYRITASKLWTHIFWLHMQYLQYHCDNGFVI